RAAPVGGGGLDGMVAPAAAGTFASAVPRFPARSLTLTFTVTAAGVEKTARPDFSFASGVSATGTQTSEPSVGRYSTRSVDRSRYSSLTSQRTSIESFLRSAETSRASGFLVSTITFHAGSLGP